jgi:AraC-type DNA-binding domain-containing proteins
LPINQLLIQQNYSVHRGTLAQYKKSNLVTAPKLIIFDLLNNNNEEINVSNTEILAELTDEITAYCDQHQLFMPTFLAYTNVEEKNKQQVFELGMLDYISHPPIKQEISYRVEQALSYYENQGKQKQSINFEYDLAESVASYLLKNIQNKFNLSALSKEFGTNRNKLSSAFKAHFGSSIFSWLREQRILLASDLLLNTSQSILQISAQVGYLDSNNFSTAFKMEMGKSPSQYRQAFLVKVP